MRELSVAVLLFYFDVGCDLKTMSSTVIAVAGG